MNNLICQEDDLDEEDDWDYGDDEDDDWDEDDGEDDDFVM